MDLMPFAPYILFIDKIGIGLYISYVAILTVKTLKNRGIDFLVCLLSAYTFSEGLKSVFNHPRPLNPLMGTVFEGSSFPSTHSSVAVALAFFYLFNSIKYNNLKYSNISVVIIFIMAFFIASLRVIVGAHFILDVIGGSIIGFLTAYLLKAYDFSIKRLK